MNVLVVSLMLNGLFFQKKMTMKIVEYQMELKHVWKILHFQFGDTCLTIIDTDRQ